LINCAGTGKTKTAIEELHGSDALPPCLSRNLVVALLVRKRI